ncbi:MAG: hypothetical protein S0880_08745 [Actinomycetota bacterium]|nr:hypothetical protein [Actinomycetota bacterium]
MSTRLTSIANRASRVLGRRMDRRGFVTRAAIAGSAIAVAGRTFALRPMSAYAAVCNCNGSTCDCSQTCCDGYTDFCCLTYGANTCPPGTVAAGWWKVDGSSFCNNGPRYYLDCNSGCGTCGCGSSGTCSGACSGTSCGCAEGSCNNRKVGCTRFRYGQCNQAIPCVGPIVCRVVTCQPPWKIDNTCGTAVRTDNATRTHDRPCLHPADVGPTSTVLPLAADWTGNGRTGIGFYNRVTGVWAERDTASDGRPDRTLSWGGRRQPLVGNWIGNGLRTPGLYDPATGRWLLRYEHRGGAIDADFAWGIGNIAVAGDWRGTGVTGIGLYDPDKRRWHLRDRADSGATDRIVDFGVADALPIVGDWAGAGYDSLGVYRPSTGDWVFRFPDGTRTSFRWRPGGLPVVGDWAGDGTVGVGVYVPGEDAWYFRDVAEVVQLQVKPRRIPVRIDPGAGQPSAPSTYDPVTGTWEAYRLDGARRGAFVWAPRMRPLTGDWNGTGRSGVGVYRPSDARWWFRNQLPGLATDHSFAWGLPPQSVQPITGDWDGDGRSGIGLYKPATGQWYTRDELVGGRTDGRFTWGRGGTAISGDWDGDGRSGVGLYEEHRRRFHMRNDLAPSGGTEWRIDWFGQRGVPFAGDWYGTGQDAPAVYDPETGRMLLRTSPTVQGDRRVSFAAP